MCELQSGKIFSRVRVMKMEVFSLAAKVSDLPPFPPMMSHPYHPYHIIKCAIESFNSPRIEDPLLRVTWQKRSEMTREGEREITSCQTIRRFGWMSHAKRGINQMSNERGKWRRGEYMAQWCAVIMTPFGMVTCVTETYCDAFLMISNSVPKI